MANYSILKSAVQSVIKTNGNNEITGAILQQTLVTLINSLGSEYQFVGVALPDTNPGTPDQNVAYLAGAGTYVNFGGIVVPSGYLGVLKGTGSTWTAERVFAGGKDYDFIIGEAGDITITTANHWAGMRFSGSAIEPSTQYTDGIVFPIEKGVQYSVDPGYSVRLFPTYPTIGTNIGTAALLSGFTPQFNGYALVTVSVGEPNIVVTKGVSGLLKAVAELTTSVTTSINELNSIKPYAEVVKNLGWGYKFNGINAYLTFNTPIVLSADGDSLELDLSVNSVGTAGYSFGSTPRSTGGGFGISRDVLWVVGDTGSDNMFLDSALPSVQNQIIKIEYVSGTVKFYRNGTLLGTYNGQKTITLYGIGHGWNGSYGYWDGIINGIKINGTAYDLAELASLTNVEMYRGDGFLTPEQSAKLDEIEPMKQYVGVVRDLGWGYKFNGSNSYCTLINPIVLSQNGDTLELKLSVDSVGTAGYSFGSTPRSTGGGFGISQDVLMVVGDTGSDVMFLDGSLPNVQHQTIKIEYINNTVKFYRNGTLLGTYNGQKTITLSGIGHGWNGSYGYWKGIIESIKVNNVEYDLSARATLYNLSLYRASGFLTDEQAQSLIPSIIVKKDTATRFHLEIVNRGNGKYLHHSFSHNTATRTIDGITYNCMDVWNADEVMYNGAQIFQGNLNMIYRVGSVDGVVASNASVNEDCHVGSTHGCEVLEFIKFFADGKEIDPTALVEELHCAVFRIVGKSKCYVADSSYDTGNANNYPKVVNGAMVENGIHYFDFEYRENNVIRGINRFIQTRNAAVKYTMMNAAMAQAYIPESNVDIFINDSENAWNNVKSQGGVLSYNIPTGYPSVNLATITLAANIVIMSRAGFLLRQQIQNDDNSMRKHCRIYTTNNNQTSVKCYLSPIITYGQTDADTINSGDEICANYLREIEFAE